MNNAEKGSEKSTVHVVTAVPLTKEEKEEIILVLKAKLKKELSIDETVDESIVAGLYVRVKDQIFDASIRTKIERLRERLLA